jgi:rhomboid-related protein 1/2/3
MLVHVGIMHLLVNIIFQIVIGIPLELVHKWYRVSIIYISGVIAGSVAHSIISKENRLAGASAGVYALLSAHIANIILNWKEMKSVVIQLIAISLLSLLDFMMFLHNNDTNLKNPVGYTAHLFGAISGLLVGIGVLRNLKDNYLEKILWIISVTIYILLMTFGICLNIFYPEYFPDLFEN